MGAGLLVGTALAVIIPEGVRALFSSGGSEAHHDAAGKKLPYKTAKFEQLKTLAALAYNERIEFSKVVE